MKLLRSFVAQGLIMCLLVISIGVLLIVRQSGNPQTATLLPGQERPTTVQTQGSVVPEHLSSVEALDSQEFADGPAGLRGSNSIWRIGVIPGIDEYTYVVIYVLARSAKEGNPANVVIVPNGIEITEQQGKLFQRYWPLPTTVDRIIITGFDNVSVGEEGVFGTMYFTTSTGYSGTLDLRSGNIILAAEPVTSTVTATVTLSL